MSQFLDQSKWEMSAEEIEIAESIGWHSLDAGSAVDRLNTDITTGLSHAEAARRAQEYGPNRLTPKAVQPIWLVFLLQFHQALVYILFAAVLVSGLFGEWVDAASEVGIYAASVPNWLNLVSRQCLIDNAARYFDVGAAVQVHAALAPLFGIQR